MGAARFPTWLVPVAAILLIAPVGYWFGPEVVAGLLLVAAVIVLVVVFATQWHSAPPAPRTSAPVASTSPTPSTHESPPDLGRLVAAAIALRLVGAIVFNLTKFNRAVAPDSDGYAYYGKMIATAWKNPAFSLEGVVGYNKRSFYQALNGVIYYFANTNPSIPLSLVNAFVGTFAAWLIARLTFRLYGKEASRRAFILAAFYPSIVLWTSINLRDAWSFALLAGSLLAAQMLREKFTTGRLLALLGCFAAMPFVRGYLLALVGAGVMASYLVVRIRRLPAALVTLAALTAFLLVVANQLGVELNVDIEDRLETMERLRNGLAYGRSAFDTSLSISTPTGAALYLPIGVANFLFSPFPWRINSWRQVMALPEALLTYWVVYHAARQVIADVRSRLPDVAAQLFVVVALTCAYGLVEGNEGTAFRHRAHALLLFFIFAAGAQVRAKVRSQASYPVTPGASAVRPSAGLGRA